MEEFKTLKSKLDYKSLGLVPTMGNLHEGHLSLLKESISENDLSVLSIFVNPSQFAKGEDFEEYPRTLEEDLQKIEKALAKLETRKDEPNVIVFSPKEEEEIYPKGFSDKVNAGKLGKVLEGELRPEHFNGVLTVVKRFFEMFKPNNAYFGKKDYQQFVLIQKMAKDEKLKVKIKGLPTVRESSGLALSSRNNYLNDEEKEKGLKLRKTLLSLQKTLQKEKSLEALQEVIQKELKADSSFNYLAIKDAQTLEEPKDLSSPVVLLGNYQVNKVRLLDNLEVDLK